MQAKELSEEPRTINRLGRTRHPRCRSSSCPEFFFFFFSRSFPRRMEGEGGRSSTRTSQICSPHFSFFGVFSRRAFPRLKTSKIRREGKKKKKKASRLSDTELLCPPPTKEHWALAKHQHASKPFSTPFQERKTKETRRYKF